MEAVNRLHSPNLRQYKRKTVVGRNKEKNVSQDVNGDQKLQQDVPDTELWQSDNVLHQNGVGMDVTVQETVQGTEVEESVVSNLFWDIGETISTDTDQQHVNSAQQSNKLPVNQELETGNTVHVSPGKAEQNSRYQQMFRSQAIVVKFLNKTPKDKLNEQPLTVTDDTSVVENSYIPDKTAEKVDETVNMGNIMPQKLVNTFENTKEQFEEQLLDGVEEINNETDTNSINILSGEMDSMQCFEESGKAENDDVNTVDNSNINDIKGKIVDFYEGVDDVIDDLDADKETVAEKEESSAIFDVITNEMLESLNKCMGTEESSEKDQDISEMKLDEASTNMSDDKKVQKETLKSVDIDVITDESETERDRTVTGDEICAVKQTEDEMVQKPDAVLPDTILVELISEESNDSVMIIEHVEAQKCGKPVETAQNLEQEQTRPNSASEICEMQDLIDLSQENMDVGDNSTGEENGAKNYDEDEIIDETHSKNLPERCEEHLGKTEGEITQKPEAILVELISDETPKNIEKVLVVQIANSDEECTIKTKNVKDNLSSETELQKLPDKSQRDGISEFDEECVEISADDTEDIINISDENIVISDQDDIDQNEDCLQEQHMEKNITDCEFTEKELHTESLGSEIGVITGNEDFIEDLENIEIAIKPTRNHKISENQQNFKIPEIIGIVSGEIIVDEIIEEADNEDISNENMNMMEIFENSDSNGVEEIPAETNDSHKSTVKYENKHQKFETMDTNQNNTQIDLSNDKLFFLEEGSDNTTQITEEENNQTETSLTGMSDEGNNKQQDIEIKEIINESPIPRNKNSGNLPDEPEDVDDDKLSLKQSEDIQHEMMHTDNKSENIESISKDSKVGDSFDEILVEEIVEETEEVHSDKSTDENFCEQYKVSTETVDKLFEEIGTNHENDDSDMIEDFVDELLEDTESNLDLSGLQSQKELSVPDEIDILCERDEAKKNESISPREMVLSRIRKVYSNSRKSTGKASVVKSLTDVIDNNLTGRAESSDFQTTIDLDVVGGKIVVDTNDCEDDCVLVPKETENVTENKSAVNTDHDYNCTESSPKEKVVAEGEVCSEQFEIMENEENDQHFDDVVTEAVVEDNADYIDTPLVIDEYASEEEDDEPPVLQEEVPISPDKFPIESLICTESLDKKKAEMPKLIPITRKKINTRMTMAQLIERKLQGNVSQIAKKLANGQETIQSEAPPILKEEISPEIPLKKPIIGSVRKSVRTTGRLTKPPWLTTLDDIDDKTIDDEAPELPEEGLTNGDMREKLASQLQALKVKKTGSLIDAKTKIPNFNKIDYKKKVLKGPKLSNVATIAPSPLGLKIVAVAGGVDLDSKEALSAEGLDSLENLMDEGGDKSFDSESNSNQVIINDHLDLPTIKLTKTKDYKKIKGWSKKKLLTLDAENEDAGDVLDQENEQPTPGCSYLGDDSQVDIKDESYSIKEESGNVFASNSLDGFLQEKDLNISYNVPNLKSSNSNINLLDACMLVDVEAEKSKSIIQPENDDSNSSSSFKDKQDEKVAYKPRTLAEKRKMMSDSLDEIDSKKQKKPEKTRGRPKKVQKIVPKKPSASVEKDPEPSQARRNEEKVNSEHDREELLVPVDSPGKIEKPNKVEKLSKAVEDPPQVVYLNEEESKPKRCVTSQLRFRSLHKQNIYTVVTRKVINRQYFTKCTDIKRKKTFDLVPIQPKPSILKAAVEDVKYLPGPLCKKQKLQVSGTNDWETMLVNLPKVTVQVVPEIGKKMPPVVRPFVKFDNFDVSKARAEYALSVLTTTNRKTKVQDGKKTFIFPVKYQHNQEKVMMRRMIPKKKRFPKTVQREEESETDIFNACESVLSDMLDYVDVKEIEDGLLKYDDDAESKTEEKLHEVFPTETKALRGQWRRRPALDKVELELRRLNVRTVNVDTEEKMDTTPEACTNFHCHMGCVCKSISNAYPPANHCGEARCIFSCTCGFEDRCKAIHEETKEDTTISERTLSRFNKEAKRNITAREERDFTQTAIRHKDKTIILGNNRVSKRTPKFNFKRFEGFHFNFTEDKIDIIERETVINETTTQKIITMDKKLNNCVVKLVRCNFDEVVPFCLEHNLYDCHCKGLAPYTQSIKQEPEKIKVEVEKESKKKIEPIKLPHTYANAEDSCSRFVLIGDYHRKRNRTNRFKNNMGRRLKYESSVNSTEIVNKWVILPTHENQASPDKSRVDDNTTDLTVETVTLIVDDENSREDLTRQKKKRKLQKNDQLSVKKKTLQIVGTHLTISGALYSPTETISKQFSAMIGYKVTTLTEFRLLLWPSMIELYENRDIQIWISSNTNKLRFIITDCLSNPKGAYTNIRDYENREPGAIKVEFVRWIVSKTMPDRKNSNNILVILRIQEMFWEICGICAKNSQNQNNAVLITDNPEKSSDDCQVLHPSGTPKEVIQPVDEKYYKTVPHVVFANGSFAMKQLALTNKTDIDLGEVKMAAALPHIVSACKWRVLKVNSNFAILAFTRNEFRIKCSDILTVMKVAGKYDKTIIINTSEVSKNYQHKLFGIYIPPNYQDRIFIGPYGCDEDHGLETLRFVNNELMNTEAFNAMRGIKNVPTTGLWYQQVGRAAESAPVKAPVSDSVIDLTDMDEVMNLMQGSDITITPTPVSFNSASNKEKRNFNARPPPQNEETVFTEKTDGSNKIPTSASLLIPCLQPDKTVKYQHVKLNLAPNVSKSARGFEHVNVDQLESPEQSPTAVPDVNNPVEQKKKKISIDSSENIYEQKQSLMDTMTLNNIIAGAKNYSPDELENCFATRLTIIMRQMKLYLPRSAKPICFRLNFGNGIILAYTHNGLVFVYWPGDCQKRFCFPGLDAAVEWLSRELHEVFICVPSTFRIMVTPVGPAHYFEYINRGIISQKYFREICIIGDFGIMRLSEAEKYLMFDDAQVAKRCLRMTTDKNVKFKRAINQIIDCNDMTKIEFQKRVQDLIKRAKAAADQPNVPQSPGSSLTQESGKARKSTPPTSATPMHNESEVICLDSDEDHEGTSSASQSTPPARTVTAVKRFDAIRTKAMLRPANFSSMKMATPVRKAAGDDSVMQIDLTHMTTEKVRELLKGHEIGDNIALTKAQVKRLRALSRNTSTSTKGKQNGIA